MPDHSGASGRVTRAHPATSVHDPLIGIHGKALELRHRRQPYSPAILCRLLTSASIISLASHRTTTVAWWTAIVRPP